MTNAPSGAAFFDAVRPLFGGRITQSQLDGMKVILDGFRQYGDGSHEKLAYVLATAFHETGRTMQPVKETQFGDKVPDDAVVKARLTKAWKAGKLPWVKHDYWSGGFFGRGYVQLTHEANYARAGREVGLDLVAEPDRALEPAIAVRVLVQGMMEGWFTGKKLGDYITGTAFDFKGARAIVNGSDKDDEIAGYAMAFLNGIRAVEKAREQPAGEANPEFPAKGAKDNEVVAQVQRRLRELGYTEIGTVDGDFGTFTENAILIFRKDNGLPISGAIDGDLIVALAKAQPRQLPAARQDAPAEEVRQTVPEAKTNWLTKVVGFWTAAGSAVLAFINWLFGSVSDVRAAVKPIADMFGAIPIWVYALIFIAGGVWLYLNGKKGEQASVAAVQEGARR
jgi:peptidoglycan hydrolase-like protein with peptidoglycan-binding domain/predicted chitinase